MFGEKKLLVSLIIAILHIPLTNASVSSITDNVLTTLRLKKQYTPYLYFTVPKDEFVACNEMDEIVSDIEKELKIKVQKFNVRRDDKAVSLRQMIGESTGMGAGISVPFLYHRESRQIIHGVASKEKVRSWAKGRWVGSSLMLDEENDLFGSSNDESKKKGGKEAPLDALGIEDEEEEEERDSAGGKFDLMEFKGRKALRDQAREEAIQKRRQQNQN